MKKHSQTWKLNFLPQAVEDLLWFRKNDRKIYMKAFDMVLSIQNDPRSGIGKPERLKYFEEEVWSRRLTQKDRIVYIIWQNINTIDIISCKEHYE